MKSPTSKVGIMEPDGMRKGSTQNERSKKIGRMTGKKLAPYSTHHGSGVPLVRFLRVTNTSKNHSTPVTMLSTKRISAKSTEVLAEKLAYLSVRSTARN